MEKTFEQCVYGKLVQRPGGPIIAGYEHDITGLSPGFPRDLARKHCQPPRIHLGQVPGFSWPRTNDGSSKNLYPWFPEGGGIVCIPVPEHECVLAYRVFYRWEQIEETRTYTQAHCIRLPVEDWRYAILPGLSDALKAESATERRFDLPLVTLNDATDVELTDLDKLCDILEVILSGRTAGIQDWGMTVKDFLGMASSCLGLLPRALAWRVPFGAGLLCDHMNELALSNALSTMSDVRRIGGEWRDRDRHDLRPGMRYTTWLRRVLKTCRTLGEASDIVASELPDLTDPRALPPDKNWCETARIIVQNMDEKARIGSLAKWFAGQCEEAPLLEFRHLSREALQLALAHFGTERGRATLSFLRGPDWVTAWTQVCQEGQLERERNSALAEILGIFGDERPQGGVLPIEHPEFLHHVASFPLPEARSITIVERLLAALKASNALSAEGDAHQADRWILLARPGSDPASWLMEWRKKADTTLCWMALRDRSRNGCEQLWVCLPSEGAKNLVEEFQANPSTPFTAIRPILELSAAADGPIIDLLAKEMWTGNPVGVCQLADFCREKEIQTTLRQALTGPDSFDSERVDAVAFSLVGAFVGGRVTPGVNETILRLLLHRWPKIQKRFSHVPSCLTGQLLRRIGQPFAYLLLDNKGRSFKPGPDHRIAEEFVRERLREGRSRQQMAEQLIRLVMENFEGAEKANALLTQWLLEVSPKDVENLPSLYVVAQLLKGCSPLRLPERLADNTREEIIGIFFFSTLEKEYDASSSIPSVTTEDQFRLLTNFIPVSSTVTLPPKQLHLLLGLILTPPLQEQTRIFWRRQISERRWEEQDGWRVAFLATDSSPLVNEPSFDELTEDEEQAVLALPGRLIAKLGWKGVPLGRRSLNEIDFGELGLTPYGRRHQYAVVLAQMANRAGAQNLNEKISTWALEWLHRDAAVSREWILKEISEKKKQTFWSGLWGGRTTGVAADLAGLLAETTRHLDLGTIQELLDRAWTPQEQRPESAPLAGNPPGPPHDPSMCG